MDRLPGGAGGAAGFGGSEVAGAVAGETDVVASSSEYRRGGLTRFGLVGDCHDGRGSLCAGIDVSGTFCALGASHLRRVRLGNGQGFGYGDGRPVGRRAGLDERGLGYARPRYGSQQGALHSTGRNESRC